MKDDLEGFEVFTRRSTPVVKYPQLTIQRRGTFSLNDAAFEALGRPEALELLFNKEKKVIGLRSVRKDTKYSYPVRKQQKAKSYLFGGKAFTYYNNIDNSSSAMRYRAEVQDGFMTIDLNQEGIAVIGARAVKSTK